MHIQKGIAGISVHTKRFPSLVQQRSAAIRARLEILLNQYPNWPRRLVCKRAWTRTHAVSRNIQARNPRSYGNIVSWPRSRASHDILRFLTVVSFVCIIIVVDESSSKTLNEKKTSAAASFVFPLVLYLHTSLFTFTLFPLSQRQLRFRQKIKLLL